MSSTLRTNVGPVAFSSPVRFLTLFERRARLRNSVTPPPGTMPSARARHAVAVEGVFEEGLALLHLRFGGGPDVDLGHAASEFGEALLEFFAVVVAVGVLDFAADLGDAPLDRPRFVPLRPGR